MGSDQIVKRETKDISQYKAIALVNRLVKFVGFQV